MSTDPLSSSGTTNDLLLQKLVVEALSFAEIQEALEEVRLSEDELLREITATLGTHAADIWASAEPERQEVQRLETEADARAIAIDTESRIDHRVFWLKNWKRYAVLVVCTIAALGLSASGIIAGRARISLIAFGFLLLIFLGLLIIRGIGRLGADRRKRH